MKNEFQAVGNNPKAKEFADILNGKDDLRKKTDALINEMAEEVSGGVMKEMGPIIDEAMGEFEEELKRKVDKFMRPFIIVLSIWGALFVGGFIALIILRHF